MSTIDYAARLTKVQAAINALLDGKMQSYDLEGQKVTFLDLGVLNAEEARLTAKIARQSRRSGAFRQASPR